jgi:hypothetical protein
LTTNPTGTNLDANGWIAEGYHLNDYGGTSEKVLWQAEHNKSLLTMLLAPWSGYTFSCVTVGCDSGSGTVHLPPAAQWRPSNTVQTRSYGPGRIVYSVDLTQPVVMVENELAIPGWQTSSSHVTPINAHVPLRAWRLSSGRYTFTSTFHEPGRIVQDLAAVVALLAWFSCGVLLYRRRMPVRG